MTKLKVSNLKKKQFLIKTKKCLKVLKAVWEQKVIFLRYMWKFFLLKRNFAGSLDNFFFSRCRSNSKIFLFQNSFVLRRQVETSKILKLCLKAKKFWCLRILSLLTFISQLEPTEFFQVHSRNIYSKQDKKTETMQKLAKTLTSSTRQNF